MACLENNVAVLGFVVVVVVMVIVVGGGFCGGCSWRCCRWTWCRSCGGV